MERQQRTADDGREGTTVTEENRTDLSDDKSKERGDER